MDSETLREKSIRSASAVLIGQALRFLISIASQILLARLLMPADFGLVAMIGPIAGFVALFSDFGLLQSVVQRPTVSQPLLSSVFWITIGISLGLALMFAALTPALVFFYGEPRLVGIGLISSLGIVISGLGQMPAALLTRQLRFGTATAIEIATLLAGLLVAVAGAYAGWGYWALIVSTLATVSLSTVLTIAVVRWWPSRPTREAEAVAMLRFGGHITGSRVVGFLNTSADNMMIGAVFGSVALGIYDRAWRLTTLSLAQLGAPIDRLAMPILSRVQDDSDRYGRAFSQMLSLLSLMVMPGLLYGILGADRWIPVLLGPRWIAAVPVFRWICLGALITPLNNAAMWLMISQQRSADALRYSTIASVINIAAYAIGLTGGLIGVARTSAMSVYFLQTPLLIWASTRTGPVDRARYLRAAAPLLLAVAAATLPLYVLTKVLPERQLYSIAIGVVLAYTLTGLVLACFAPGRRILTSAWNILPGSVTRLLVRCFPVRIIRRGQTSYSEREI